MNKFTIHCTEEQTKKAIKLGAPIKATFLDIPNMFEYEGCYVEIPTTEEMLGWFRSKNIHVVIHKDFIDKWSAYAHEIEPVEFTVFHGLTGYNSFEEVTLAAIDATLDYLENK